jgi:hypothetical protein
VLNVHVLVPIRRARMPSPRRAALADEARVMDASGRGD